jgi:hypothetical protein
MSMSKAVYQTSALEILPAHAQSAYLAECTCGRELSSARVAKLLPLRTHLMVGDALTTSLAPALALHREGRVCWGRGLPVLHLLCFREILGKEALSDLSLLSLYLVV